MKDLKEGSYVLVRNRYGEGIDVVKKITPTGIIKLEKSDYSFDTNGRERGADSFNTSYITLLKESDRRRFQKRKIKSDIQALAGEFECIDTTEYTLEELQDLLQAVDNLDIRT